MHKGNRLSRHQGSLANSKRLHFQTERTVMTQDEIILAQQARIEQLLSVVEDLSGLIDESSGVYGLHLNGDPSPWEELLPGGRFERITNFYEALATQDDLSALRAHDVALENCRLFAARNRNEEWAKTILRFCGEAGIIGSPLRVGAIEKGGE